MEVGGKARTSRQEIISLARIEKPDRTKKTVETGKPTDKGHLPNIREMSTHHEL